jgi:hypothetical protein
MDLLNILKTLYEKLKPLIMDDKPQDPQQEKPEDAEASAEETPEVTPEEEVPSEVEEPKPAPHPLVSITPFTVSTAIFNGVGVGLLLGMLFSLTMSPVVSGIIGTLSSMLALLLGLNERFLSPLKSLRIGAFGLSCVAGMLLGMYIRTNQALSPSMKSLKEEYIEVGFTEEEALDFIAYKKFNLAPTSWLRGEVATDEPDTTDEALADQEPAEVEPDQDIAEAVPPKSIKPSGGGRVLANPQSNIVHKADASLLFSATLDASLCADIEEVNEGQELDELVNSFMLQVASDGEKNVWKTIATHFKQDLPKAILAKALITVKDGFCNLLLDESEPIKLQECTGYPASMSLQAMQSKLATEGQAWQIIVKNVSERIPIEHQKALYRSLIKSFCDEENE